MPLNDTIKRAATLTKLKKNAARRGEAFVEYEESRRELAKLLRAGRAAGVPVTKMCAAAGVNRERVYELLRRDDLPRPKEAYKNEGSTA